MPVTHVRRGSKHFDFLHAIDQRLQERAHDQAGVGGAVVGSIYTLLVTLLQEYLRAFTLPGTIRAGLEDYRAAASRDFEDDNTLVLDYELELGAFRTIYKHQITN